MAEVKKINGYTIKDEQARNDIESLNTNVNQLNAVVSDLKSDMLTVKAGVNLNTTNIESLTNTVSQLNKDIKRQSDKNYVLISDSYGIDSATGGASWITLVSEKVNVIKSIVVNGGGFSQPDGDKSFYTAFNNLALNNEITDVIMLCGANDGARIHQGTATKDGVIAGMQKALPVLKTKYPKAKIYLGHIGRHTEVKRGFAQSCETYREYAGVCGCGYIANTEYILHNNTLLGDGIHPTQAGSDLIYRYIMSFIHGGEINVSYEYDYIYKSLCFTVNVNNGKTRVRVGAAANKNQEYIVIDKAEELMMFGNMYLQTWFSNVHIPDLAPETPNQVSANIMSVMHVSETRYDVALHLSFAYHYLNQYIICGDPTTITPTSVDFPVFYFECDSLYC